MWSVVFDYLIDKNEPGSEHLGKYEKEEPKTLEQNQQTFLKHETKLDIPQDFEKRTTIKLTPAFGVIRFEKIAKVLAFQLPQDRIQNGHEVNVDQLKKQALLELQTLFAKSLSNAVRALQYEIIQGLLSNMAHQDKEMRVLVASVLSQMSQEYNCRQKLIPFLNRISKSLGEDKDPSVRLHFFTLLERIGNDVPLGVNYLNEFFISFLVTRAKLELNIIMQGLINGTTNSILEATPIAILSLKILSQAFLALGHCCEAKTSKNKKLIEMGALLFGKSALDGMIEVLKKKSKILKTEVILEIFKTVQSISVFFSKIDLCPICVESSVEIGMIPSFFEALKVIEEVKTRAYIYQSLMHLSVPISGKFAFSALMNEENSPNFKLFEILVNEINDFVINFEDPFSLRQHINMFQLLCCLSEENKMNSFFKKTVVGTLPTFLKKLQNFLEEQSHNECIKEKEKEEFVPQNRKNHLYVADKIYGKAEKTENENENEKKDDLECLVKDKRGNVKGKFVCKLEMEKENYRCELYEVLQKSIQAAFAKVTRTI